MTINFRYKTVKRPDGTEVKTPPIPILLSGKITPAYGIGGKVDSAETRVNITIEKGHERYNLQIPVKVILGDYDFPILLGRAGFFDKFIISFYQAQEKVSLKKFMKT